MEKKEKEYIDQVEAITDIDIILIVDEAKKQIQLKKYENKLIIKRYSYFERIQEIIDLGSDEREKVFMELKEDSYLYKGRKDELIDLMKTIRGNIFHVFEINEIGILNEVPESFFIYSDNENQSSFMYEKAYETAVNIGKEIAESYGGGFSDATKDIKVLTNEISTYLEEIKECNEQFKIEQEKYNEKVTILQNKISEIKNELEKFGLENDIENPIGESYVYVKEKDTKKYYLEELQKVKEEENLDE